MTVEGAAMAYADGVNAVAEVRYSHEAMIDVLIARPMATQREVARHFGYTEAWVSQVMASDSFKKRFAERRDTLVDPMITKSLEHLFEGVGRLSLAIVEEKLEATRDPDLAIKAMEITRKGLGLGVRDSNVTVQNFVAVVPAKAASYEDWVGVHRPAGHNNSPLGHQPEPPLSHTPIPTEPPFFEEIEDVEELNQHIMVELGEDDDDDLDR
jgi:hypothetical protein